MKCIVCKKPLKNVFGDDDPDNNQPSGGTAFKTHGHYGSTVFDPMDGTYLEINICDACLKAAGEDGNVLIGFPKPAPPKGPMMRWPLTDVETERHSR